MHYFSKRIKRLRFKLKDLISIVPQSRLIAVRKKLLSMGGKGREYLSNNFGNLICDRLPAERCFLTTAEDEEGKQTNSLLVVGFPLFKAKSKFFLSAKSSAGLRTAAVQKGLEARYVTSRRKTSFS